MTVKEVLRRVAEELRRVKAQLHGRLEELAAARGRRRDYITKITSLKSYSFPRLLEVLDICGVEPQVFFARALDIRPDPDSFLREVQRPGEESRAWRRIDKVTRDVEWRDPPTGEAPGGSARLEELTRSSRTRQRKRLRDTKKFQTVAFLRRYLVYVDDLRYESPPASAFLAKTVAGDVVPLMIATKRERIETQCRAVGIFASAQRTLGHYTVASQALLLALDVARRHGLEAMVADLLHRGAFVLYDFGQLNRALSLLAGAHLIYSDLADPLALGQVQVGRGIMFSQLGEHRSALRAFKRALEALPKHGIPERWRFAAEHGIVEVYRRLGDYDSAENLLTGVLESSHLLPGGVVAKSLWLQSKIARDKGELERAEKILLETLRMTCAKSSPLDAVLVSLDLVQVLLRLERFQHATSLVKQLPALMVGFKGNKLAQSALSKLTQAGLAGEVSQALVERTAKKLKEGVPAARHAQIRV